jgi:nucleotide-binding universal stress UspA family protein
MLEIKRILYPTDFSSCAGHALPYTIDLAERCGAEVHVFHTLVIHDVDPGNAAHRLPNMEELYRALEEQAESQMKAAMDRHGGPGFNIQRAQLRGISAGGGILEYSAANDIDLIVMGTHGRRGLRRLLLGSVAEEIVRLAPCPVLTVPEKDRDSDPSHVRHILAPVDFSEYSRLAIRYALELARMFGARLHLLHVVDEVIYPDFYPPVVPSGGPLTDELRDQSSARLQSLITESNADDLAIEAHVRAGRAPHQIAAFATEIEADLIVIASHGLTGIGHMLLGSVTEQVVRRVPCPVFTVKATGKALL